MKSYLLLLPLLLFLQTGSCEDDDTPSDEAGDLTENYMNFMGGTSEAFGGCNQDSTSGDDLICVYAGSFVLDGLGYAIAITHKGLCRSASFSIDEQALEEGEAIVILQASESGVTIETFRGVSGTVTLVDSGTNVSFRINGTVQSTTDDSLEAIEGYIICPNP